jgi:hypothetical protein
MWKRKVETHVFCALPNLPGNLTNCSNPDVIHCYLLTEYRKNTFTIHRGHTTFINPVKDGFFSMGIVEM